MVLDGELGPAPHGIDVTRVEDVDAATVVLACGAWSADVAGRFGVDLPVRPLCRQLLLTSAVPGLDPLLPMVIEAETGFHFRRRGDRLVLAMADAEPRWTHEPWVDESVFGDRRERLASRYPPAAAVVIEDAWAGLYDMTPDAHPIIGPVADGVYAACGFSGHGLQQAPAVGRGLAEWIAAGRYETLDLSPLGYERIERGELIRELNVV